MPIRPSEAHFSSQQVRYSRITASVNLQLSVKISSSVMLFCLDVVDQGIGEDLQFEESAEPWMIGASYDETATTQALPSVVVRQSHLLEGWLLIFVQLMLKIPNLRIRRDDTAFMGRKRTSDLMLSFTSSFTQQPIWEVSLTNAAVVCF